MVPTSFVRQGFRADYFETIKSEKYKFALYRLYDERDDNSFIGVEVFLVKTAPRDTYAFGKQLYFEGEEYIDRSSAHAGGVSVWYFSQASNMESAEHQAVRFVKNFKPNRYFVRKKEKVHNG